MDIFTASESAYLNGYKRGYVDGAMGYEPICEIEEDYYDEDDKPSCTKTKN